MDEDQTKTWPETTPYDLPADFFAWGLGGPITDFGCGPADMTEDPADDGRIAISEFQAGSGLSGLCGSAPGLASFASGKFEEPQLDFKEPRHEVSDNQDDEDLGTDNGHELCLREKNSAKVAATAEVLEERESTNRAHRKPAVEAHARVNTKSKAVGYKPDTAMTPSAHGGGDQLLQMPNIQQGSTTVNTQEELPSGGGGTQGATQGQSDNMVQEVAGVYSIENVKLKATKNSLFDIPKHPKEEYKLFLNATPEDFERGTLNVLKCKLCHGANFKTWDHFTRHCRTAETHPLELFFCDRCGDFFARSDSLERHSNNRASECRDVAPNAEVKRNETIAMHREFLSKTKAHLKTNRGIWTPFAQVVKERYPDSSKRIKRRNRQKSRVQAPESGSS